MPPREDAVDSLEALVEELKRTYRRVVRDEAELLRLRRAAAANRGAEAPEWSVKVRREEDAPPPPPPPPPIETPVVASALASREWDWEAARRRARAAVQQSPPPPPPPPPTPPPPPPTTPTQLLSTSRTRVVYHTPRGRRVLLE